MRARDVTYGRKRSPSALAPRTRRRQWHADKQITPMARIKMMITTRAGGQDRAPTPEQVEAVRHVMRRLAEDERERSIRRQQPLPQLICDACRHVRAGAGSVRYEDYQLCNGCATEYEVRRLSGQIRDVAGYLALGL